MATELNNGVAGSALSTVGVGQYVAFRVAIVGAGPSGFYAAQALLQERLDISVTNFEKLPVPYGLVRYGVAPDHLKLKQIGAVFDRIAQIPNFRFIGNVCIGEDLTVDDLHKHFHAVVLATGAECPRSLGIPGEKLGACHSAGEFVAWYNGNPYYRNLKINLAVESVVIVGLGNVALDVARILCKSAEELYESDIASHALEALHQSKVRKIFIVGRGGPLDAKFTSKELREFYTLENCSVRVDSQYPEDVLAECSDYSRDMQQIIALLGKFTQSECDKARHCEVKLRSTPVAFHGKDCVKSVELNTPDGPTVIPAGLVFSSIGWSTTAMLGIPYDSAGGVHANVDGRICSDGQPVEGLYTVGWSKRGANGVIGTNRVCGRSTADVIVEDLPALKQRRLFSPDNLESRLHESNVQRTDYSGWQNIDRAEREQGIAEGRPRVKLTTVAELLAAAKQQGENAKCP